MVSWTKKTTTAGKSCAPQLASTTVVKVTIVTGRDYKNGPGPGQKEYNRWANKFDNIIIQQQESDLLAHPINLLSSWLPLLFSPTNHPTTNINKNVSRILLSSSTCHGWPGCIHRRTVLSKWAITPRPVPSFSGVPIVPRYLLDNTVIPALNVGGGGGSVGGDGDVNSDSV